MPEIKNQLRLQTDEAISRGVFGVPSMEVGGELFWVTMTFPTLSFSWQATIPLIRQNGHVEAVRFSVLSAQNVSVHE